MSHRRYKVGLHPFYDKEFSRVKGSSNIINPKRASHFSNAVVALATAQGCRGLLESYARRGDPYGKRLRTPYGVIQEKEVRIQEIEDEFEKLKQTKLNFGQPPPKEMPKDLYRKLMLAQARHDVICEEADLIRKKLAQFEDAAEAVRMSAILPRGPCGVARGDPVRIIDGQAVSMTIEGTLFIDEPDSPYNGMMLSDYRQHVIGPFIRNRKTRLKAVKREDLPPWPDSVQSVLDEKKEKANDK